MTKELLKQLYEKHLDLTIDESIEYEDWIHYFEKLNKRANEIATHFPTGTDTLRAYCEHKIKTLRSLKLNTSYLLSQDKREEALSSIFSVALEVRHSY